MSTLSALLISDTHGTHWQQNLQSDRRYDVLIHAGDFTNLGKAQEVRDFMAWIAQLQQFEHIVYIAGNHDIDYSAAPLTTLDNGTQLHYLHNRSVTISGVKFYGSPMTPRFYDWAFMYDPQQAKDIWAAIPGDTDVLITHGPPFGVLDKCPDRSGVLRSVGCPDLLAAVQSIASIKLHVFGHIHEGYGEVVHECGRTSINASAVYEHRRRSPVAFSIPTV